MVRKAADFLRITDDDGLLSLTHLALYVGLGLLIAGRSIPWTDLSAFVVALASYRVKRALETTDSADSETVARLGQTVTALQAQVKKLDTPDRYRNLGDGLKRNP